MTREEYIKNLLQTYSLVAVLSEKNDCKVLRLRNNATGQDLVLRSFPKHLDAYEILCTIRCENLPEIYDALDVDDGQIILEEYIDGITVAEVMQTGKYRYRGAKKILGEICNALSVLHSRGIVHRDIKPENVVVEKTGRVVLIDFNASRKESGASKDTVIMGTVGYASPEQLGLSQSDARTDIYAAGVLLNVMLTGRHPTESFARGRVGRIVRKCTALNPNDRYQSADKLALAL
ncbi:MAG: serine/threonine protein kinase [Oscillospiraceae bacterium]|nr:serine/threonine protein kinase [Oscillospiraceae bacterium]